MKEESSERSGCGGVTEGGGCGGVDRGVEEERDEGRYGGSDRERGATRALMRRRAEGATSGGGAMAPCQGMEAAAAGVRVWGR